MKRTAKFRVGQVVAHCQTSSYGSKEYVLGYGRVLELHPNGEEKFLVSTHAQWYVDYRTTGYHLYTRPLTAREIGPRPAKGRKG